ncbi:hypothetical protein HBH43_106510 [Parastagonospora nodorum]|nr:hypothetical protein HBH43_106510 [Parastagonospora nodorum]
MIPLAITEMTARAVVASPEATARRGSAVALLRQADVIAAIELRLLSGEEAQTVQEPCVMLVAYITQSLHVRWEARL